MKIEPYSSIDSLKFGESTLDDCVTYYGSPERDFVNREGVKELHYNDFILRFSDEGNALNECTLLPCKSATISGIEVTWDTHFLKKACDLDGSPRNVYGFIVLLKLGIAVTGIHDNDESQMAVTVFSEGGFDDLLGDSTAFKM